MCIRDRNAHADRTVGAILDRVKAFRTKAAGADSTKFQDRPHLFTRRSWKDAACIAVPSVSSERRTYVPMRFLPAGVVVGHTAYTAYEPRPMHFALLQSLMHMSWVRTVAGRMKSDYRYSNTLCYNTFPFPELDDEARERLDESARAILSARERWPDRSLADLYDPDKMPANLRATHEANDAIVDSLYRKKPFTSDADRMEVLLSMYRDLVAQADGANKPNEIAAT